MNQHEDRVEDAFRSGYEQALKEARQYSGLDIKSWAQEEMRKILPELPPSDPVATMEQMGRLIALQYVAYHGLEEK